eukprot:SAG31_NODE_34377_length_333_cov_1.324786_1_plen_97_part_10
MHSPNIEGLVAYPLLLSRVCVVRSSTVVNNFEMNMIGNVNIGDSYVDKLEIQSSTELFARTKIGAPLILGKDYVCDLPELACEYLEVFYPINGHSDL